MKYLHTMIRVTNLEKSLHFYTQGLGFELVRKDDYAKDKFTLAFLKAPGDDKNGPMIELTHNWGVESYIRGDAYGHVAYRVESVAIVQERLKQHGYDLSWGPGRTPDGRKAMAFVDDPDGFEIELLE
ncbi:MAG: lactoylglutathione lyase [Deltaproteobacteria bacterium]|nr:lactoylglutathione lyase [Deltaproteobacteria bacterium]